MATVTDRIHENGFISLQVCALQAFCLRTKFTWAHSAPWMEGRSTHWEFHTDSRTHLDTLEAWNSVAQHFLKGQVAFCFKSTLFVWKPRYNSKVFQALVHAFEALDRRGAWMISYADYSWAQDLIARCVCMSSLVVCVFDRLGHLSKDRGMLCGGVWKVHKLFVQHI